MRGAQSHMMLLVEEIMLGICEAGNFRVGSRD